MVLAARRLIFRRSDWDATGGVKMERCYGV